MNTFELASAWIFTIAVCIGFVWVAVETFKEVRKAWIENQEKKRDLAPTQKVNRIFAEGERRMESKVRLHGRVAGWKRW